MIPEKPPLLFYVILQQEPRGNILRDLRSVSRTALVNYPTLLRSPHTGFAR